MSVSRKVAATAVAAAIALISTHGAASAQNSSASFFAVRAPLFN